MKKKFIALIVALSAVFNGVSLFISASAGQAERSDLVELSPADYETYVKSLLRPVFFENFFNSMTVGASDFSVSNDKFTGTNVPKPSGIGGSAGDVLIGTGLDIIKGIITDAPMDSQNNFHIPEFKQYTGKLRVGYANGLTEIITCTITYYYSLENWHCILNWVRQLNDYYSSTTLCDSESEKYCEFDAVGNVSLVSFLIQSSGFARFYEFDTGDYTGYHAGSGVKFNGFMFYDIENDVYELKNPRSTGSTTMLDIGGLCFWSFSEDGLPYYPSGVSYQNIFSLCENSKIYSSGDGRPLGQGSVYSVSASVTNSYPEYVQQENNNADTPCKQAITYLSEISSNTVINQNNISNYDFLSISNDHLVVDNDSFESWYQSTIASEINNSIVNIYQTSWAEVVSSTESPSDPPATVPVATTYVPAVYDGETYTLDTSHFVLDYETAVKSPYDELKAVAQVPVESAKNAGLLLTTAFNVLPDDFVKIYVFALFLGIIFWFLYRK